MPHICDYYYAPKPAPTAVRREIPYLDRAAMADALQFHQTLPDYVPSRLVELPNLAQTLGLGALYLKDESSRFGLNAFKALGASYSIHRYLRDNLHNHLHDHTPQENSPNSNPSEAHQITFCTATDGNHGRAVAWTAKTLGHRAVVYVPANTVQARIDAIRREGAEVVVVQGHYDAATRCAESAALGSKLNFLGATIDSKGFNSWFGAAFVMLTGLGLFEVCRRQFAVEWGQIQEAIEKEIKRREAL